MGIAAFLLTTEYPVTVNRATSHNSFSTPFGSLDADYGDTYLQGGISWRGVSPRARFGFPDSCCCVSPHSSSSPHRGQRLPLQHSGQEDKSRILLTVSFWLQTGEGKRHHLLSITHQAGGSPLEPSRNRAVEQRWREGQV